MIVVEIDVGGTFTDVAAVDEETGAVSLTEAPRPRAMRDVPF